MSANLALISSELTGHNKDLVLRILNSALEAVQPRKSIHGHVKRTDSMITIGSNSYDLENYRKIFVVGIGKAVLEMGRGLIDIIGDEISQGILVAKHIDQNIDDLVLHGMKVLIGGHPVPSERSVSAAQEIMQLLDQTTAEDLVICLISGGGSALVSLPAESISLYDLQLVTELLLVCGADICEINLIRKKLDRIKGGGLALQAAPSGVVALILSDVIGSDPAVIASGPTFVHAENANISIANIFTKYNLTNRLPDAVRILLNQEMNGDTVSKGLKGKNIQVRNEIIANNYSAARTGAEAAASAGFNSMLVSTYMRGEASQVGRVMAGILCQMAESGDPIQRPACLVFGGETTVTLKGDGKGGRNLELALGSVLDVQGLLDIALVTLATDGEDRITGTAGALVTGQTRYRGQLMGLDENDYLRRNDSYHYFEKLGNLIQCKPTGTNVNDLVFLFAFAQGKGYIAI
jgi:glycerate 2-kinase